MSNKRKVTCSICKEQGHNKRTCPKKKMVVEALEVAYEQRKTNSMPLPNLGTIAPKEIVEGMLCTNITQLKNTLDAIYHWDVEIEGKRFTQLEGMFAGFYQIYHELEDTLYFLKDYHDKALSPRHRGVRTICLLFKEYMTEIDLLKHKDEIGTDINHPLVIMFLKSYINFISTYHHIFDDKTPTKDRNAIVTDYTLLMQQDVEGIKGLTVGEA